MSITFLPETSREAELLGKARELEVQLAKLEAEREQFLQEVALLRDQNAFMLDEAFQWKAERAELRRTLAEREVRIHDLERQLGRNSQNSSKPPSTDRPRQPSREKPASGRKPGAQPGHRGASRQSFGVPDRVVELPVDSCDQCGRSLCDQAPLPGRHHQVAEWVARPVEVVEYHHLVKFCPDCKHRVEAPYPADIIPGSRFGPRLLAVWAMFNRWGFMSVEKLEHLFNEQFELPLSHGSITNGLLRVHEALESPYKGLGASLPKQPFLHIDETAWWIDGEQHYVWTFGNASFSYLKVTKHRNREVVESVLGKEFPGWVVSDFFDVYDVYPGQRCLAHLLRDLKAASEEPDDESRVFAREMTDFLKEGYALWDQYQQRPEHFVALRQHATTLRETCKAYLKGLPDRVSEPVRLLRKRFEQYWEEIWFFLDHPDVPPDNNLAERSLRPVVTFRKMSGGSRSFWGADLTAEVHTVVDTCRKQGRDPFEFIVSALLASAQPEQHKPPSLLNP